MAAPALVALAPASRDLRATKTISALVDEVKAQRPDLRVERAHLDPDGTAARWTRPELHTVVDRLVKAGHDEIVIVPLALSEAFGGLSGLSEAIAAIDARHPGLQVRASAPLGLEACFLEVLDEHDS